MDNWIKLRISAVNNSYSALAEYFLIKNFLMDGPNKACTWVS